MKKIITILGARPQFIKTPLLSKELAKFSTEIIVHTGQHYDDKMSDLFFRELKIKKPKYNLGVGSAEQGEQTAKMLAGIEKILLKEKPDLIIIYGDTNSTVAGALAAAKLHLPVAHIEAGLRSYNRQMPEEINRIVSDHIAELLFAPTKNAVRILKKEGIASGVYNVGDVMAEMMEKFKSQKSLSLSQAKRRGQAKVKIMKDYNIKAKKYLLVTVHRQENTDNKENLKNIFKALLTIEQTIIFPAHPRTKKAIEKYHLDKLLSRAPHIRFIDPVGYLEMISLELNAKMILTDSGGVQKESYVAKVPCLTLRKETEWIETVQSGWNVLCGTNVNKIVRLAKHFPKPKSHPNFLGTGHASEKIASQIRKFLKA